MPRGHPAAALAGAIAVAAAMGVFVGATGGEPDREPGPSPAADRGDAERRGSVGREGRGSRPGGNGPEKSQRGSREQVSREPREHGRPATRSAAARETRAESGSGGTDQNPLAPSSSSGTVRETPPEPAAQPDPSLLGAPTEHGKQAQPNPDALTR